MGWGSGLVGFGGCELGGLMGWVGGLGWVN